MKFADYLNGPLPSQAGNVLTEGYDDVSDEDVIEPSDMTGEPTGGELDAECGPEGCKTTEGDVEDLADDIDDIDDDDEDDIDDLSDDDLEDLDAELSGAVDDAIAGDEDEVSLSPDEEVEADDMMSVAATAMLVNDELNSKEKKDFLSKEATIAINEGFMTVADVNNMKQSLLNSTFFTEANNYNKKMLIRLDAAAKKKQLYAIAVNVSAKAHGDPDYYKLKKVMKVRKVLRAKLDKKYHSEATKRMRVYYKRLTTSKSPTLNKIGNKK